KSLLLLLKNIDRTRFNPVVVTMYSDGVNDFFYRDFQQLDIPIYHLHLKSWRDVATFRQLRKIIRRHRIDIAHSHYGSLEFFGTLYARLAGVRHCIYTKHNQRINTDFSYRFQRFLLNRILTERILSISQTVSRHIVSREFVPIRKIELVYNPIEIQNPEIDKERHKAIRRQFNIPENRFIIGNTSRLAEFKGFDIFYATLSNLISADFPIHGLVLSDEETLAGHISLQRGFNIESHITILPFQEDMNLVYACLDCFLFTSKLEEGFGMALVEAMAASVAAVGLNVGVIPEIVKDGQTGLLPYPPKWMPAFTGSVAEAAQSIAESIKKIIRNPKLKIRLVTNAAAFVQQFDARNFTRRIEKVYKNINR
ncbi:MAG: glycosyltransferase family 4 protein, partial [Candidatus Marinimicrobia bacterium]|nr:glycosyltransferase family 4 protein [Candidatus Neomarinimicrobiota bacterium]